jgi:4-carboxymuconolactone decarboxylase
MTTSQRVLVEASTLLAVGDTQALDEVLARAAGTMDPSAVEETLLQSYLFLGYPAALRGLGAWRRVSGSATPVASRDNQEWRQRGQATCRRVYGRQYDRLRHNIRQLHPDMEEWMVVEGYGKVLGRPGLDLPTRELCIVALLAAQDAAPQLYSHLRGALNAGASVEDVDETVALIAPLLPEQRRAVLEQQWNAVQHRRPSET